MKHTGSHCVKTYHSDDINNLVLGLRLDQETREGKRQGGRMDLNAVPRKPSSRVLWRKKPALTVRSHMKQQLPRAVGGDGNMDTIPPELVCRLLRGTPGCTPRWRFMPACMYFNLRMCDRSLMHLHFHLEFFFFQCILLKMLPYW